MAGVADGSIIASIMVHHMTNSRRAYGAAPIMGIINMPPNRNVVKRPVAATAASAASTIQRSFRAARSASETGSAPPVSVNVRCLFR